MSDVISANDAQTDAAIPTDPVVVPPVLPATDAPAHDNSPVETSSGDEPAAADVDGVETVLADTGEPTVPAAILDPVSADEGVAATGEVELAIGESKEDELVQKIPASSDPVITTESNNSPQPSLTLRGEEDKTPLSLPISADGQSALADTVPATPPATREAEKIVTEIEKPLTDEDKEHIFKDRLAANLIRARSMKHARYEKRLQDIVDFIRARGTLVTNQDIEEGLMLTDTTVTNRLNALIKRRLVMRVGEKRHAAYRLVSAV